jgi:hypothetical protein
MRAENTTRLDPRGWEILIVGHGRVGSPHGELADNGAIVDANIVTYDGIVMDQYMIADLTSFTYRYVFPYATELAVSSAGAN